MYLFTGMIGLFFMTAPFALHFTGNASALLASIGIGGSALVASIVEKYHAKRKKLRHWVMEGLHFIIFMTPLQFGFTSDVIIILIGSLVFRIYAIILDSKKYKKRSQVVQKGRFVNLLKVSGSR